MEKSDLFRIELLLELVADELYMARLDRESKGESDTVWLEGGGREEWEKGIDEMRKKLAKLD